jgi:hypothetical protein
LIFSAAACKKIMKIFEITKTYRGGQRVFYISLADHEYITSEMLEHLGEYVSGGENYGYQMSAKEIAELPEGKILLPRQVTQTLY